MRNSFWVHIACPRSNHKFSARRCQPRRKWVEATPARSRKIWILRSYLKSTDSSHISVCHLSLPRSPTTAISCRPSSCCVIWMSPFVASRASADWIIVCRPAKLLCPSYCRPAVFLEGRSFSGLGRICSRISQALGGHGRPCSFSSWCIGVRGYAA